MEKKTIGQFIAVLRRANGLTQKQLAEQLNVSDKAVSRWERDECAPDLSLIPVIADLFGVTSDEILRGERKAPAVGAGDTGETVQEASVPDRRSEKQLKHLLDSTLHQFRIRSVIVGGIGLLGLLGAALCSVAVGTAFGGFIVGCILLVSAAVAETVSLLSARASLAADGLDDGRISDCRRCLYETAFWVYALLASVLTFILPLLILPIKYYGGHDLELSFSNGTVDNRSWMYFGGINTLVGAAVLLLGWVLYRIRRKSGRRPVNN